jgi:uncharacterized protein (TIRG00374 family)
LLLFWVLRNVSLREAWAVLTRLSPAQLLILAVANAGVLLTLSGRWWLILRAQGHPIPYLTLAGYRLAGFGVSYFTPGSQFGGEPLQVYLVQRRHQVPRSTAIAAVALDKSLELVGNFAFLTFGMVCVLQWQVFPGLAGRQAILLPLLLLSLPIGFLLAIWAGRHPVSGALQIGSRIFSRRWSSGRGGSDRHRRAQRAQRAIRDSEDQATRFCRDHPFTIVQGVSFSLLSWAAITVEYGLALHFLGQSITLAETITALTAARLAFLLPLPGGLGALEASQVLALGALGVNPSAGISLSLLIRARDIALGGLGLWWGGLRS